MRSSCAFPGCKSGSASEKKHNKLHGLRNKSMFKFPDADKFPVIRQTWEKYIGRQAKETDVLCELHFREQDVQRNYEVLLSSGIQHTMERGRVTLKPKAVPQNDMCNKENPEPRNTTLNICSKEINHSSNKAKKLTILGQPKENISCCSRLIGTSTLSICINELGNGENCIAMDIEKTPNQCNEVVNFITNNVKPNPKSKKNCDDPTCAIEPQNMIGVSEQTPTISLKCDKSKSTSLEALYLELQGMELPNQWSALQLTEGDGAMLIGHFSNNRSAQKEFVIHSDGSVQVFIKKKSVNLDGIKAGATTDNVLHNISVLQSVLLCNGTSTIVGY